MSSIYNKTFRLIAFVILTSAVASSTVAQGVRCDPTKTMSAETCAKCHGNEVQVWQSTPHHKTYEELSRRPRSKEICRNMGLGSAVKRNDVCTQCHFTMQEKGSRVKAIAGISCESCHGASKDWVNVHNNYGGPTATQDSETCLLYTSPSPRDKRQSRMPSSA